MSLRESIPNPFDNQGTLSGLAKKAQVLKQSVSLGSLLRGNIMFVLVTGALAYFAEIPLLPVGILLGADLVVSLTLGYFRVRELEGLSALDQQRPDTYRRVIVLSEKYRFFDSAVSIPVNAAAAGAVWFLYADEIVAFVQENFVVAVPHAEYLIFLLVAYRVFDAGVRYKRWQWVGQLSGTGSFAQLNKEYLVLQKKVEVIKMVPGFAIATLGTALTPLPWFFPVGAATLGVVFCGLGLVEYRRIGTVDVSGTVDSSVVEHAMTPYRDEQFAGAVFGITKVAASFWDVLRPQGISFLGAGKNYHPENSLVVTNYRLLLVQVPVSGGNAIVDGTDYARQNVFFNRGELRSAGERFVSENSLGGVLSQTTKDVLFGDIEQLVLKKYKFVIHRTDGSKLAYAFMDAQLAKDLRRYFSFYLRDAFVDKA